MEDPVIIPIDGALDLHTFSPREVGEVVPAYLEECLREGIFEVRIIHGKGTGSLARSVRAILDRLPEVIEHRPAGPTEGSWGATVVVLDKGAKVR